MRKKITIVVVLLIAISFTVSLVYLYQKNAASPIVFETKTPEQKAISKKIIATGSIVPKEEITIKPNISGIIKKLFIEAGDQVKSGDLIAEVRIIPSASSLSSAKNRVDQANANLENQKRNFDRQKALHQEGAISTKNMDAITLTYQQAKIDYNSAKENYDIIKTGTTSSLKNNSNTLIRSTITGMVLDVPIKIGNQVIEANNFNEGTTIAILADVNQMIFDGKIDESEVEKIKEDLPIEITVGAILDKIFKATLTYIAPKGVLENNAVQFKIKGMLEKPDMFIRPGLSANASIIIGSTDGEVLCIEESLLQFDENEKPFVELQRQGQEFEKKYIILGVSDGMYVEIKEGVTIEDHIKIWAPSADDKEKKNRRYGKR